MEKKTTLLLKWGRVVIVLLGMMVFAISGNFQIAKADTMTAAVPNDPNPGSCQFVWSASGLNNVGLDLSQVTNQGLQATLVNYQLDCNPANFTSCTLIPGIAATQDTVLDLTNIQNVSPWIYGQLTSESYGLDCHRS